MSRGHKLASVISCCCWSPDCTQLALCPNDHTLQVYSCGAEGPWEMARCLQLHDGLISGVDWCPTSNRIVTCSHDCNAFVLAFKGGQWQPDMVITRLKRAALCVRWAPCGSRFAIGGAAKEVSVCSTQGEDAWWGASILRKHGSAVLGIAWQPQGRLLATACADGVCRIFNGGDATPSQPSKFAGDLLLEVPVAGWGIAVAWADSGEQLVCSSQQSQLTIMSGISLGQGELKVATTQRLQPPLLPLKSVIYLSENCLAAAGFDGSPSLFQRGSDGTWETSQRSFESQERPALNERDAVDNTAADFSAKLAMFKSPIIKGKKQDAGSSNAAHSSTILEVQRLGAAKFSTAALDGRIIVWGV